MVGVLLLNACVQVPITDSMWCGSLGASGASCAHTLTDQTQQMSLQEFAVWWNDLSNPKVATTLAALTELKADLEKLCTFSGDCSVQTQTAVEAAYAKVAAAHAAAVRTALPKK